MLNCWQNWINIQSYLIAWFGELDKSRICGDMTARNGDCSTFHNSNRTTTKIRVHSRSVGRSVKSRMQYGTLFLFSAGKGTSFLYLWAITSSSSSIFSYEFCDITSIWLKEQTKFANNRLTFPFKLSSPKKVKWRECTLFLL